MGSLIQRIFREHFPAYERGRRLPPRVLKAARAVCACRTAALGGHVQACPDGHVERVWYNSCKHRACPVCAFVRVEEWIRRQFERLLDCDYYHTVFTIPEELTAFWEANRGAFMNLLFQAAWGSLKELLADLKYLGATPGALATFQSWGQTLWLHPHAHFLVTGGGLTTDGEWKAPGSGQLLPARVLSAKFRGKLLAFVRKALEDGRLKAPPSLSATQCQNLLNKLGRQKWHVMIMPPYRHGRGVVRYLGRYVRGAPVSDRRLAGYDGQTVQLRYKDNRDEADNGQPKSKVLALTTEEFITRVGQHVPEPGLHVVRAYGLFAPAAAKRLNAARTRLGQLPVPPAETLDWQSACEQAGNRHPERCPVCGKKLICLRLLPPLPHAASRWRDAA